MTSTTQSNIFFNDCVNNSYQSKNAELSNTDYKLSNDNIVADDILFNDIMLIEAKFGQRYLHAAVANANCDCGR